MKRIILLLAAMLSLTLLGGCTKKYTDASVPYTITDGTIHFDAPAREPGQQSVLGFKTDPIPTVRIGFVGLGMRGADAVERYTHIEGVEIKAICDKVPAKVDEVQKMLAERGFPEAAAYTGEEGYKELCERDDIDLVYVCTSWQMHVNVAVYAMEHGKHAVSEVPVASTLADCWRLVNTAEKYQRHCMILENCCYDFFEMTCLNMAQQGLFGEVLHGEGAYIHCLDPFWKHYQDNWRLEWNQSHRGDLYATHGFGPVCQIMNIHRGDKMDCLVAMDTKSVLGTQKVREMMNLDTCLNGDHTITLIRTHNGKTIEIQHDVMTPRPYDRLYQLTGTKGFANKYPVEGFSFVPENLSADDVPEYDKLDAHDFVSEKNFNALMEKYKHPIHRIIEETAKEYGGHGGMDYVMDWRLIYCLHNGLPLDMDVYDAAEWSCVSELGAVSMNHGSLPVEVPDFTRGDWNKIQGLHLAE